MMIQLRSDEEVLSVIKNLCNEEITSWIHLNGILANISAYLHSILEEINWVGFYYLMDDSSLVLGPFQGKVACMILTKGRGVCQKAVEDKHIVNVDDVHHFSTHIACDSQSMSEIVIPIIANNNIIAVLDIDSPIKSYFSKDLEDLLEKVGEIMNALFEQAQDYLDILSISKHYRESSDEREE